MKVKELIARLEEMPLDGDVILQKDAEGNGFSPLREIVRGFYKPLNTWDGEFMEREDGDGIVLVPIN